MSVSQSHSPIQTTVPATLISTAVAERQTPIYQSPQKPRSGECRQDFCRRYDGNESEMDEQEEKGDLLFRRIS